jgi:hypothetical protein
MRVTFIRQIPSFLAASVLDANVILHNVIGFAAFVLPTGPGFFLPSPTVSSVPFRSSICVIDAGVTPTALAAAVIDG